MNQLLLWICFVITLSTDAYVGSDFFGQFVFALSNYDYLDTMWCDETHLFCLFTQHTDWDYCGYH